MAFTKRLRNYFFSTSGDTQINGFWQRFLGGGISKPTEQTMSDLTASVPFFTEVTSAAQTDSIEALQNKQGLVIAASDASAKAGSDVALGSTGGTLSVKPSQLPNVIDSITDQTIRDFTGKPLEIVTDATGSNNKYSARLRSTFLTTLLKFLLPSFTTGDALKVVRVNAGETAYELGTIAPGTSGASYNGTSSTGNTIAKGAKTFAITPASGTFAVAIGNRIRFTDSSDSTRYVEGIVSAVTPSSSITILADNTGGTGSLTTTTYNLGGNIPSTDTTGVANLYVDSLSGDDTTGDGSINKPFKTISKAKSVVINNQTVIVFGGSYTNAVNLVKAGVTYTLFCFPGVTITQTTTSMIDSLAISGRVDIEGEPNIVCTALSVACFVINEVSVSKLGKVVSLYKFADLYTKLYKLDGITTENTVFTFREASWESTSVPAIKLMRSASNPQGTILLNSGSLEYTAGVSATSPTYIEVADPYTASISGNLQYRGSGTLTTPSLIKVTSTSFAELAINRLTCRLGGTATINAKILDLGANNLSSNKVLVKDVVVTLSAATFVTASTASSIYAENIYMVTGSTIEGGSATIKTIAPAVANTRTFVAGDTNFGTPFNII